MVTLGVAACVSGKLRFSDKSSTRSTRATRILCPANPRRLVAAAAAPPEAPPRSIDYGECAPAPVPREQVEIVRSLNGWVAENMLPLLNPVESSWQPHDFLPCSAGAPEEDEALSAFTEGLCELRLGAAGVPDEVLVCLVGNMVTEEALPSYQSMGNRTDGIADDTGDSGLPWARWLRGWATEENRHGDLLNRYLYLSGRVDMRQVEATVHHLLRNGMGMVVPKSPYHSVIYGAFQERATFVSHGHTGRLARQHGDGALARICGVIAADEKRHEAGYTRVSAGSSSWTLTAWCVMRGKVTMPGLLMSDGQDDDDDSLFARFSAVAQRAGVHTARDYGHLPR
ncbi:hypothetical protein BRADI_1g25010v3 [Brachypodium distachyon]|uniref:Acyl-[acyl-carrier-protein] desaturase n=1 Tax=Brachypodium distachyon TaxID=15368 RepID=A0A2K2DL00_BRADI|nr:hypothetical protein BRADI_1g25010v3 [Brachypodium distachyon]